MRKHHTVAESAGLLTFNKGLEVDMFSNRHMPDSPKWKLQSEYKGVMVYLSLRHQHTIPIVESCKNKRDHWCRLNNYPLIIFSLIQTKITGMKPVKDYGPDLATTKRSSHGPVWKHSSNFCQMYKFTRYHHNKQKPEKGQMSNGSTEGDGETSSGLYQMLNFKHSLVWK